MPAVSPGRRAALEVLRASSRGRRLDLALDQACARLPLRERRWVQEVSYGVARLRGRIDFLLDLHLRRGRGSLSGLALDLLRLGAYQLLYMDGVPSYAAISQTVDQVREVGGDGGGRLANGVLRSLEREGGGEERFPAFESDPRRHIATWHSHPQWLVDRWLARWDPAEVRDLARANNHPPPLFFRPLGSSIEAAAALLSAAGFEADRVAEGVPCLQMGHGTNPAILVQEVRGIVQDPGSALVTVYADPPPGSWVADLCAAPGGKALAMAEEVPYVLAADAALPRLRILKENLARVGGPVGVVAAQAQRPPLKEVQYLLLDVPCTGTGTLRRHPDARWRLEPRTVKQLADLQAEILEAGAGLVAPGGHLLYATCSLEIEENETQVDTFLRRHPEFEILETGAVQPRFLDEKGRLTVLPHRSGFDGAFGARMGRRA